MSFIHSITNPEQTREAYLIAAGYTLALHHGVVPRISRDKEGHLRAHVPLLPDEILSESSVHLAASSGLYSNDHASRILSQSFRSLDIVGAQLLMATLLEEIDLSIGPPRRAPLKRKEQPVYVMQCLNACWAAGQDGPSKEANLKRVCGTALTDLQGIVSKLALLTEQNPVQMRLAFFDALRQAAVLLEENWETICRLVEHLLTYGGLSVADACRLGHTAFWGEFQTGSPLAGLMAFHRDQLRATRHTTAAWAGLGANKKPDHDEDANARPRKLSASRIRELLTAVASVPSLRMLHKEPATRFLDLRSEESIFKAGRLLLGVYNGSFLKLEGWSFKEVLPDSYQALPIPCLEKPSKYLNARHRARILEQAGWELQSLFAGLAAKILEVEGVRRRRIKCPVSELLSDVEDSAALLRVRYLLPGDGDQPTEHVKKMWGECCSILRKHWTSVLDLKRLIEAVSTPRLDDVLFLAGDLTARRFDNDPVNELLFRQMREQQAMEQSRAAEDESYPDAEDAGDDGGSGA